MGWEINITSRWGILSSHVWWTSTLDGPGPSPTIRFSKKILWAFFFSTKYLEKHQTTVTMVIMILMGAFNCQTQDQTTNSCLIGTQTTCLKSTTLGSSTTFRGGTGKREGNQSSRNTRTTREGIKSRLSTRRCTETDSWALWRERFFAITSRRYELL